MEFFQSDGFWKFIDRLVTEHEIVIDRPKGTPHPRYPEFIYPMDYGYLKGVISSDQNDLDVWMGSSKSGCITGIACVTDDTKGDMELKILYSCTHSDLNMIYETQNRNGMHAIIITR
jgi:inorganic pyrophosphatase